MLPSSSSLCRIPVVAAGRIRVPVTTAKNFHVGKQRRSLVRCRSYGFRSFSSSSNADTTSRIQILQYPASASPPDDENIPKHTLHYDPITGKSQPLSTKSSDQLTQSTPLHHFLPALYPQSVAPGYWEFSLCCFAASVAGSAAMVLSTQSLLVAVVGGGSTAAASSTATATTGVAAGALNWILKDGIGQLGGVLFASNVSTNKQFDANPKRWRVVAALCLDTASILEMITPVLPSLVIGSLALWSSAGTVSADTLLLGTYSWPSLAVLGVASTATILKNIGFLTAGASRAALHQSLAISNNLADVTIKSGSQSVAAGLLGTGLGIGILTLLSSSAAVDGGAVSPVLAAFGLLVGVHQTGTYLSVSAVPLRHFNQQRLFLVCDHFLQHENAVLSPGQVAQEEIFVPGRRDTVDWLHIGTDLEQLLRLEERISPKDEASYSLVSRMLQEQKHSLHPNYILLSDAETQHVHLTFLKQATGEDQITGMFHALHLRRQLLAEGQEGLDTTVIGERAQELVESMREQGWMTGTTETNIEPNGAVRLDINFAAPDV